MFANHNYVNRAITLSSTFAIGLSITLPAAAQNRFMDIDSDYWASSYVQALTEANIISGFPDSTYRPDEQMTRAQFASVLSGGFPTPPTRAPITFDDVPEDHWAAGAISSASTPSARAIAAWRKISSLRSSVSATVIAPQRLKPVATPVSASIDP